MKDKDKIKDLFSEKLGNYQAKVNPVLWENIASRVAVQSTGAAAGISLLGKIVIGTIFAAALTGLVIYGLSESPEKREIENKQAQTSSVESTDNKSITEQKLEVEQIISEETGIKSAVENKEHNSFVAEDLISEKENNETIINDQIMVVAETKEPLEVVEKVATEEVNSPIKKETANLPKEVAEEQGIKTEPAKKEEPTPQETYSIEKMPNFFSPNNDGQNDVFFINSSGLEEFNLVVMNENNKTVFKSSDPNFKWDGTGINGLPISKGRYVYFLTAKDESGNPVNKYSSLTVR